LLKSTAKTSKGSDNLMNKNVLCLRICAAQNEGNFIIELPKKKKGQQLFQSQL
jgi:hypothetical protein